MDHSGSPSPPAPSDAYQHNQGFMLPQISPHRSVISGGQPLETIYNSHHQTWNGNSLFKHLSEVFPIKQEPGFGLPSQCQRETPASLSFMQKPRIPHYNHLSPLPTSNPNMQHLQLPGGTSAARVRCSNGRLGFLQICSTRAACKNIHKLCSDSTASQAEKL